MTLAPAEDLIVRCAECDSSYRLPAALLGSRGARVRCRACGACFEVRRDARGEDARAIALLVVERLADHEARLVLAQQHGRLFAEAGDAVLEAFAEFRRRAGEGAPASAFRDALRARWGIDLPGGDEARAHSEVTHSESSTGRA
jgi:predicted Zn finger-like uncharacterized protein